MAGDYIITGGRPLNGTVRVPAAKNSVLPLLAASLLCSGPVRLCGVPELADVAESLALLRSAGCTAERQGADVRVDGVPGSGTLAAGPAGRMRASILFCAPLLARLGRAQTVLPGGCRIGARPIDLHLAGLVQMGACPQLEGERLLLTAPAGLHGADITLRFPSVGATETLLLAAALAWLLAERTLQGRGLSVLTKALRTVFPLAVLAGICYNFCVYFAAEPQLMGQNPALYENVSRLVQFWL